MVFSVSRCTHSAQYPLRGMCRSGVDPSDPNVLIFTCGTCRQQSRQARCAATTTTRGTRCRAVAVPGRPTCRMHVFDYCPDCRNEAPADLCRMRSPLRPCVVEGPGISSPNVARCGLQTCAEHADFEPRAARYTGR